MSRIRSIHPGQWSDEDFVQCSAFARLLALGIRNEADDNGIFEWKPLTLKMKIFPADNVDVSSLLEELVNQNQIYKYEVGGRGYGLIRNFTKFQKPKKPSFIYTVPNQFPASYELHGEYNPKDSEPGGIKKSISSEPKKAKASINSEPTPPLSATSSEPVPNQFPASTEIPIQRERREEKEEELEKNIPSTSQRNKLPSTERTPREDGSFDFSEKEKSKPPPTVAFSIMALLGDDGHAEARKAAPGWDVYYLAGLFDALVNQKKMERPKFPDKAFPAWCKIYTKGKPPA